MSSVPTINEETVDASNAQTNSVSTSNEVVNKNLENVQQPISNKTQSNVVGKLI